MPLVIKETLSTARQPAATTQDSRARDSACAGASRLSVKPLVFGLMAGTGIIAFYLGLNTLTADWFYAKAQFSDYRWWLVALATGLGAQVVLYTALRSHMVGAARKTATSSMATSGGVSAASMAACCAHYLAALLPTFSAPFFSAAAASLEKYQHYFFLAGIVSCGLGLVLMIRLLKKKRDRPAIRFRSRPAAAGLPSMPLNKLRRKHP